MTEREKYEKLVENSFFIPSHLKPGNLNEDYAQNWGSHTAPFGDLPGFGLLGKILDKILKALALAAAGIGALALLAAKKIGLRKLKNYMLKLVDWTEYGFHKSKTKNAFMPYFRSETDKYRHSYNSYLGQAQRDMIIHTEKLLKCAGLKK